MVHPKGIQKAVLYPLFFNPRWNFKSGELITANFSLEREQDHSHASWADWEWREDVVVCHCCGCGNAHTASFVFGILPHTLLCMYMSCSRAGRFRFWCFSHRSSACPDGPCRVYAMVGFVKRTSGVTVGPGNWKQRSFPRLPIPFDARQELALLILNPSNIQTGSC